LGLAVGVVAEQGFKHPKAPVQMVTAMATQVPFSERLEHYVLPDEEKIIQAAKSVTWQAVSKVVSAWVAA
jgi:pyruvate dehydrogenase E1 component beta subunit